MPAPPPRNSASMAAVKSLTSSPICRSWCDGLASCVVCAWPGCRAPQRTHTQGIDVTRGSQTQRSLSSPYRCCRSQSPALVKPAGRDVTTGAAAWRASGTREVAARDRPGGGPHVTTRRYLWPSTPLHPALAAISSMDTWIVPLRGVAVQCTLGSPATVKKGEARCLIANGFRLDTWKLLSQSGWSKP
jgi:hypothetical protein